MAQLLSQLENRKIVLYKFTRKTQTPSPNKNPHNPTQARHLPVFQALSEAYGPRGIRVAAIKNLAQLYCNNLNRYASLVFRERYIFSIQIQNREFQLLVHRAKKHLSDVRYLSGAESRLFSLLSLLALLPLLPDNLRSNICILDEMEANLSRSSRELFVREFLPVLQKMVPNIFIITPLTAQDFYIPQAKNLRVVRQNGVSTITKS
jgi:DNA repair exonuclease SbcCD ATPase subunit